MIYLAVLIAFALFFWFIVKKKPKPETGNINIDTTYEISNQDDNDEVQANHYYKLGKKSYDRNNFTKAIEYYTIAISYKKHYVFFNNRGCAKCYVEQYGSAIDDFTIAISLNLEIALIFLNRGWVYFTIEKQDLACKDWRRAAKLGSERAQELTRQYCPRMGEKKREIDEEPRKPKKKVFHEEGVLELFET